MKSLILICILTLSYCTNYKLVEKSKHNNSLKIKYINGTLESPIGITCDRLDLIKDPLTTDTILYDSIFLNKIESLLNNLEETLDKNQYCDFRLLCRFIKDNDTVKICLGEFNCIMVDDKKMKENDTLSYLLLSESGYYNYFPRKYLEHFSEINKFGIPKDYIDLSMDLRKKIQKDP